MGYGSKSFVFPIQNKFSIMGIIKENAERDTKVFYVASQSRKYIIFLKRFSQTYTVSYVENGRKVLLKTKKNQQKLLTRIVDEI